MEIRNVNCLNHSLNAKANKENPSFGISPRIKKAAKSECFNVVASTPMLFLEGPLFYGFMKPLIDSAAILSMQLHYAEGKKFLKQFDIKTLHGQDQYIIKTDSFKLLRETLRNEAPLNTWRPLVAFIDTLGDKIGNSINSIKNRKK